MGLLPRKLSAEKRVHPHGMCQVCERTVQVLRDGTSRPHKRRPGTRDIYSDYCGGSGYRNARWEVGQKLRHHGGSVWEVVEDRGGRYGDYLVRCVVGVRSFSDADRWLEEPGKTMVTHGEYMHRDGWTPIGEGLGDE